MKLGILPRRLLRWSALRCTVDQRIFRSHCQTNTSFQRKSRSRKPQIKDLNSALKPFFFMVHPDLFGNYPEKRNINENSLMKLNSFLQALVAKRKQPNEKLSLKFFVRDPYQQDMDSITEILVEIGGKSPFMVVEEILRSVGLPGLLNDNEKVITSPWKKFQSNVAQYHASNNLKYDDETITKYETLLTFLEKKSTIARTRLNRSSELRKKSLVLIEKICKEFGFKSVSVESKWRILLLYGYLKNLYAVLDRHKNEVQSATGWKVFLCSWGGVDAEGVIHLNVEDEPLSWIKLLSSVDRFSKILQETENMKLAISQMLGHLDIINAEYGKKHQHLEVFLQSLNDLHSNLNSTVCQKDVDICLCGYKGVISSTVKTASVLPSGSFLIPVSTNKSDLVSFLTTSVAEAKHAKDMCKRQLDKEKQIIELCVKCLGLQSLTRNTGVNHIEMTRCCEDLINIGNTLAEGLKVKVGHVYHMSADGELTIPWNWKDKMYINTQDS